ncbi:MAG TPA: calcium-binding protein [Allosphingosinicella sp.]|nr:calcium-binding protein [Allosphingosinicella sp.]
MATIFGTAAGETLTGTRLADDIFGLEGDDIIRGRGGNDQVDGGTGADFLIGRTGSDHYFVDAQLDKMVERLGEGDADTVFATVSFILRRNVEHLELRGEAVRGYGNDLANRLTVEDGQDVDNVLNGRGGADFMSGGRGDDIYHVDDVNDTIEEVGFDTDTVRSSVSFTLGDDRDPTEQPAFLENLVLVGSAAINGTGGELSNQIRGNSADNVLKGLVGLDTLNGGAGDDSLYGGRNSDTLTGGEGNDGFYITQLLFGAGFADIIRDFTTADDTFYLDRSVYTELPEGPLPESAFVRGSQAQDADDRILYDSATGYVFYDPDGSGDHLSAIFAQLVPGTEVNSSDFIGY